MKKKSKRIFLIFSILKDTELTFNYNLDCLSNAKAICKCGSKNCSGFIGDRPKNLNAINSNGNGINNGGSSIAKSAEPKKTNRKASSRLSIGGGETNKIAVKLARAKSNVGSGQKKKNSRKSIC